MNYNDMFLNSAVFNLDKQIREIDEKMSFCTETHEIDEGSLLDLLTRKKELKNRKSRYSMKKKGGSNG